MYVCVLDQEGNVLVSKDIPTAAEPFLQLIAPYREDLAVAVECMFTWYWLADLCAREKVVFVLGHALYMRAIHGGKAKNDRIDAPNVLFCGGPRRRLHRHRAGGPSAATKGSAPTSLCHLRERDKNLDRLKRYRDCVVS